MWALRVEISKQRAGEPVAPDKLINKASNDWSSESGYTSNLILSLHCHLFRKPYIGNFGLSRVVTP